MDTIIVHVCALCKIKVAHMNISFSERLVKIRQDRGLTQDAMAAIGGVQKRAQLYYEHGERMPDVSYLQNLAGHFAQLKSPIDLLHLVMGEVTPTATDVLSADEAALITAYRKAPQVGKDFIRQAAGMAANVTAKSPAAPAANFGVDLVADYKPSRKKKGEGNT